MRARSAPWSCCFSYIVYMFDMFSGYYFPFIITFLLLSLFSYYFPHYFPNFIILLLLSFHFPIINFVRMMQEKVSYLFGWQQSSS